MNLDNPLSTQDIDKLDSILRLVAQKETKIHDLEHQIAEKKPLVRAAESRMRVLGAESEALNQATTTLWEAFNSKMELLSEGKDRVAMLETELQDLTGPDVDATGAQEMTRLRQQMADERRRHNGLQVAGDRLTYDEEDVDRALGRYRGDLKALEDEAARREEAAMLSKEKLAATARTGEAVRNRTGQIMKDVDDVKHGNEMDNVRAEAHKMEAELGGLKRGRERLEKRLSRARQSVAEAKLAYTRTRSDANTKLKTKRANLKAICESAEQHADEIERMSQVVDTKFPVRMDELHRTERRLEDEIVEEVQRQNNIRDSMKKLRDLENLAIKAEQRAASAEARYDTLIAEKGRVHGEKMQLLEAISRCHTREGDTSAARELALALDTVAVKRRVRDQLRVRLGAVQGACGELLDELDNDEDFNRLMACVG